MRLIQAESQEEVIFVQASARGWQRAFDEPIVLPGGENLVTTRRCNVHHQIAEEGKRVAGSGRPQSKR